MSEQVKKLRHKSVKYLLISVGTNDLDDKDNEQVFGELELVLADIRTQFLGIKFIINKLLPREDERNSEIGEFNRRLGDYAKTRHNTTIASQQNIKDMSMFYDNKHLTNRRSRYTQKNIINALLKAYGIKEKSELFTNPGVQQIFGNGQYNRNTSGHTFQPSYRRTNMFHMNNNSNNIDNNNINNNSINNNNNNNNMFHNDNNNILFHNNNGGNRNGGRGSIDDIAMRDAVTQFSNILMKCIQIQRWNTLLCKSFSYWYRKGNFTNSGKRKLSKFDSIMNRVVIRYRPHVKR